MTDTLLATLAIIDAYLWGPWTMAFLAGVAAGAGVLLAARRRKDDD